MYCDLKSRRFIERQPTSLMAIVRWIDGEGVEFERELQLIDMCRGGARIAMPTRQDIGQPVFLRFAMPRIFRVYDKAEKDYEIWGIVRNIWENLDEQTGITRFETGVAFIGKQAPSGFLNDSTKRYDLKPTPSQQGLWFERELIRRMAR